MDAFIVKYRLKYSTTNNVEVDGRDNAIALAKELRNFYKEKLDLVQIYKLEYDYDATVESHQ